MDTTHKLEFRLPVPPSLNNIFINVQKHGRAKSREYRAWLSEADKWYYLQRLNKLKPINGPRALHIRLPRIRGDASNRIKVIEDWLVSRKLTGDDRHNLRVSVEVDSGSVNHCVVTVTPL
jgi:hypothetical protein